jgi:hypothetical protein
MSSHPFPECQAAFEFEADIVSGMYDYALYKPVKQVLVEFMQHGTLFAKVDKCCSFFNAHSGIKGVLSIDKLTYDGLSHEEHLIFTVITEDGTVLDEDIINSMLCLPAEIIGDCPAETPELIRLRELRLGTQQEQIEEANKQFYLEECDKLDAYSEDLKEGLQRKRKELNKLIKEKEKECRASTSLPLDQIIAMKDEINKLKDKRKKLQREIYQQEDEIDMQRDKLQEEIRQKLNGQTEIDHIMTISFEVV